MVVYCAPILTEVLRRYRGTTQGHQSVFLHDQYSLVVHHRILIMSSTWIFYQRRGTLTVRLGGTAMLLQGRFTGAQIALFCCVSMHYVYLHIYNDTITTLSRTSYKCELVTIHALHPRLIGVTWFVRVGRLVGFFFKFKSFWGNLSILGGFFLLLYKKHHFYFGT